MKKSESDNTGLQHGWRREGGEVWGRRKEKNGESVRGKGERGRKGVRIVYSCERERGVIL